MNHQPFHQTGCTAFLNTRDLPVALAVSFHSPEGVPMPIRHWSKAILNLLRCSSLDIVDTVDAPRYLHSDQTYLGQDDTPTVLITTVSLQRHGPKELAGRTEIMTGVASVRIADCSEDPQGRFDPAEPVIASAEFTLALRHIPDNREALPRLAPAATVPA